MVDRRVCCHRTLSSYRSDNEIIIGHQQWSLILLSSAGIAGHVIWASSSWISCWRDFVHCVVFESGGKNDRFELAVVTSGWEELEVSIPPLLAMRHKTYRSQLDKKGRHQLTFLSAAGLQTLQRPRQTYVTSDIRLDHAVSCDRHEREWHWPSYYTQHDVEKQFAESMKRESIYSSGITNRNLINMPVLQLRIFQLCQVLPQIWQWKRQKGPKQFLIAASC